MVCKTRRVRNRIIEVRNRNGLSLVWCTGDLGVEDLCNNTVLLYLIFLFYGSCYYV